MEFVKKYWWIILMLAAAGAAVYYFFFYKKGEGTAAANGSSSNTTANGNEFNQGDVQYLTTDELTYILPRNYVPPTISNAGTLTPAPVTFNRNIFQ
jgi:flagellar basal body-associated protein FliL